MQLGFKYICVKKVCLEKLFEMESRSQSRAIYLKKKGEKKRRVLTFPFSWAAFLWGHSYLVFEKECI